MPPEKEVSGSEDRAGTADDDDTGLNKRHSSIGKSKNLLGGGMGFGNLINPNILAEKRLKKVHHDEKKDKPEEKNVLTDVGKGEVTGKTKTPLVDYIFLKKKNLHEAKKQFIKNKPAKIHTGSKSSKTSTMMTKKGGKKKTKKSEIATCTTFLLNLICKCTILWQCECFRNLTGFVWWMAKLGK